MKTSASPPAISPAILPFSHFKLSQDWPNVILWAHHCPILYSLSPAFALRFFHSSHPGKTTFFKLQFKCFWSHLSLHVSGRGIFFAPTALYVFSLKQSPYQYCLHNSFPFRLSSLGAEMMMVPLYHLEIGSLTFEWVSSSITGNFYLWLVKGFSSLEGVTWLETPGQSP